MDYTEHVSKSPIGGAVRRRAALAAVLLAAALAGEVAGQPAGLFLEAAPGPDAIGRLSPVAPDSLALRSRRVRIDFAQLASPDVAVAARAAGVPAEAPLTVRPARKRQGCARRRCRSGAVVPAGCRAGPCHGAEQPRSHVRQRGGRAAGALAAVHGTA